MKKLIIYIASISIVAGAGYHIYKTFKETDKELEVIGLPAKPISTPLPTYEPTIQATYEPTYIIHNLDGTIDFKFDRNYIENVNGPLPTPETIIINHNEIESTSLRKGK